MKVIVKENRELEIVEPSGTKNENKATEIELEVPEQYQDWNKKIAFKTATGVDFDFIIDNTYTIQLPLTKNRELTFYIWLTKDDKDFRSVTKTIYLNENSDVTTELTPEEVSEVNQFIAYLDVEKQQMDNLMEDIVNYMESPFVTFTLDENGDLIAEVKEWQE